MKYALALGGGVARGAFEAGVWKAIEELGLEIEAIAGTSVGAINGAAFAAGTDVCKVWRSIDVNDVVASGQDNNNLLSMKGLMAVFKKSFSGGLDTTPLKNLISEYIPEERVRKSPVKFGLCTYSISEKKSIELFIDDIPEGRLTDYIVASACLPGFKTEIIKGEKFFDGGLRNALPVNMLTKKGYTNIISVSVRGWGFKRDFEAGGVNIINLEISDDCEGFVDFDNDSIERNIGRGYIALMREFGEIEGGKYAFRSDEYKNLIRNFGRGFPENIEKAAEYLKLPDFCIYSFNDIATRLINEGEKNKKVKKVIEIIEQSDSNFVKEKIDLLGDLFITASTVVYLKNNFKTN
jgi:NTE family protein